MPHYFEIDVIDPCIAQSFSAVREELRAMYPSLGWRGEIRAPALSPAPEPPRSSLTAASLYSGGVDSTWTAGKAWLSRATHEVMEMAGEEGFEPSIP